MRVSGGFESGVNQQFLVLSIVPLRQSNLPWVGVLKFSTQGLQRESNSQTQDPDQNWSGTPLAPGNAPEGAVDARRTP
eukprot:CAMPEP_0114320992 /NCGR_PEP_ID=MMETSP0059-20121206/26299_1 /TAXON_ID=36894 /ORGANISM="Pyramimonas parkeae, Strain CCMP726" /LENGTH=77 /DNA_ID=CAMNT_0001448561 /DNA_START=261 /DNA_END=491 /DNA_ORIENTATION=+